MTQSQVTPQRSDLELARRRPHDRLPPPQPSGGPKGCHLLFLSLRHDPRDVGAIKVPHAATAGLPWFSAEVEPQKEHLLRGLKEQSWGTAPLTAHLRPSWHATEGGCPKLPHFGNEELAGALRHTMLDAEAAGVALRVVAGPHPQPDDRATRGFNGDHYEEVPIRALDPLLRGDELFRLGRRRRREGLSRLAWIPRPGRHHEQDALSFGIGGVPELYTVDGDDLLPGKDLEPLIDDTRVSERHGSDAVHLRKFVPRNNG